ncbi:hypothetical protein DICA1_F06964 [Diutina catenulata]
MEVTRAKLGTFSAMSLIVNKIIGTGIYSNPAIIFQFVEGNVGLYLTLFALGGAIIGCGLLIYLEFAMNLPFTNGGEKNYLMRVCHRFPSGLAGCVYAFAMVLLGFSSGNSYTFGKYILYAINGEERANDTLVKFIGVACITGCVYVHYKHPNSGMRAFNALGLIKVLVLVLIIAIGVLVGLGWVQTGDDFDNFHDIWHFENRPSIYNISVALLQVIYSFKGWENANYVLSEVENPVTVLMFAAPMAVFVTTILYFMVVISYLVVIPKNEFLSSGVLCAGIFFTKVFGQSVTARALPVMIAISNLGNVMVVSYAHSVVNQELARNNYLPWSHVWQKWSASLFLHWIVTVIVLVGPPSSEIYEFIVNLYIYPGTWINVAITAGLLYLRWTPEEDWNSGYKETQIESSASVIEFDAADSDEATARTPLSPPQSRRRRLSVVSTAGRTIVKSPYICIYLFLIANVFLAVFPFIPPQNQDTDIPYWMFPVIGTGVLIMGGVFWKFRRPGTKYEEGYAALHQ